MSKLIALNLGNPPRSQETQRRGSHPSNPSARTLAIWGARPTASGADVTEQSALRCLTVFACIKILSETSAMLPLKTYRQLKDGGKTPALDHELYPVLHDEANPEMSSMTFRETLIGHVAGWGNGYAWKEMNGAGKVIALWPLRPDRTWPERLEDKRLVYHTVLPNGTQRTRPADEILHVRTLGGDGLCGYSPIGQVREAVGLALATEEFGSRFFGQGALPGFVFKHPGLLGKEAADNLKQSWREEHQGLGRSHMIEVLEEGMGIEKIGIPPDDAQFLETRQFQDRQIAKLYRIPLHMLADMEKGSGFSSVEQLGLEFVVFSLMPWLVRLEQECQRSLLLPSDKKQIVIKHVVQGLARGDLKSRNEAYAVGRMWGWLSVNNIRELEDMNPIGPEGDVYLSPLNMVPADQLGQVPAATPAAKRLYEHQHGGNGNGKHAAAGANLED